MPDIARCTDSLGGWEPLDDALKELAIDGDAMAEQLSTIVIDIDFSPTTA